METEKIEWGIDPCNWTIGLNIGSAGNYVVMFTLGPLYLIVWPDNVRHE